MIYSDLAQTAPEMCAPDYTDRFIAEYVQLKIRYLKLELMVNKYESKELDFVPRTPISGLKKQLEIMKDYMTILEMRATIEKVWLPEVVI